MARSMLQLVRLSHKFWEEAVGTACYIQNRGFHQSLGMTTPFELWHGHKPNLDNLRIFGCIAFAFVPEAKRNKLDARATKSIFIGYGEANGYKAYKLFNPKPKESSSAEVCFFKKIHFSQQYLTPLHIPQIFHSHLTNFLRSCYLPHLSLSHLPPHILKPINHLAKA